MGHAVAVAVRRLRARQEEIGELIFARVSDQWFDQAGSEDPEYVAGMRAAGIAALDYVLVGVERSGDSLLPVPLAALDQARRAARAGVGLDTVLRRYLAGYVVLEGFVMQQAEQDERDGTPPAQPSALRELLQKISSLVDRLITAVSSAYSNEVERAGKSAVPGESEVSEQPLTAAASERVSPRYRTPQRDRILEAMVEIAGERGFEKTSVKLVTRRAGVSTSTFYEEFKNLQECFVAVLDLSLERAGGLIALAFARHESWQDGVLDALASLLVLFDSERLLTRVWFVEAMSAGSWALERREQIVGRLRSMIVEHWAALGDEPPDAVVAAGVMASVLGLIQTHLVTEQPEPLIELLGPLLGLVGTLYVDKANRAREVDRGAALAREIQTGSTGWTPPAPAKLESPEHEGALPARLADPGARRARECLLYLAEHAGASNSEIASAIGVAHKSQIARLLSYLLDEDLAVKHSGGVGSPNAWQITARGQEVARAIAKRED